MTFKIKLLLIKIMINITTQELNKLTLENFTPRLAQANLETQSHIAHLLKKTDFDNKLKNVTSNKHELRYQKS